MKNYIGAIFLAIGAILLCVGIIQGDYADTLSKAVKICYECIGIG